MKNLFTIFILLIYLGTFAQNKETDYHWPVPENWGAEHFAIPISFAPQIPYRGIEDIRFSPGWANKKSKTYWTYTFLWYIDSISPINTKTINRNVNAYYKGLIKANKQKVGEATTSLKQTKTVAGDLKTFSGTVQITDYMQWKPIVLHCIVHVKNCTLTNKTVLCFALSPKPFTHPNWQMLNQLWLNFRCTKN